MQEQFLIIKELLLSIWHKKHYAIISSWLICPLAWLAISSMPDQYESEARVYVDTQSLIRPLMRGLMVETDPNTQVNLIVKTLLSRPNLERIARMTDLDIQAETEEDYERIINNLRSDIKFSAAGRENIFTIAITEKEPELAKNIVQSALTVFIENTLGETRQDTDSAHKFLDEQIEDYEKRLLESETRLKNFKQQYSGFLEGDTVNFRQALAAEKARLKEAELALREAQTRLDSAQAQLVGEEPVFGLYSGNSGANSFTTEYDSRLIALQQRIDEMLLLYTERHPDIKELKRRYDDLNALREEEIERYIEVQKNNPQAVTNLNENPVYQDMKIQANNLQNEVASLKVRVNDYRQRVQGLETNILAIPEIDAKLTALNRGYDITKARYEELLERKETAMLAQEAERTTEKIQFRVIDPPKLPLEPSGPYRVLYFIASFIVALAAGFGIAFLQIQINPTVISSNQLTRTTKLPVFGVISATENLNIMTKYKRQNRLFIVSTSVLFAILVLFIIYFQVPDLIQPHVKRFF
ncbi:XrtA system polysaccharide chain length determinant [Thalassotalea maritima]|uniref:XrtA system polysaccharide chain length determinant n=1 Tax=Thalassotalea maritima TaxID=3242416 RepID=UPI0035276F57